MEINRENLRKININTLTLKQEFGALVFDNAHKKLVKIRNWITELEDLDYQNELPVNLVNSINNFVEEFLNHLRWLENFNITTSGNPKQDHDNFESRIDDFYNNFISTVLSSLTYLRQEAEKKSKDKRKIYSERKELVQVRKQYDAMISDLKLQLKSLQQEKNKIAATHGEIGAVKFGKHFEREELKDDRKAIKWLELRDYWFRVLLYIIIANFVIYFYLFIANKLSWWPKFPPKDFFTLEYGLVKLALLTLLSYAISFASRNYNVNSNLSTLNCHRKNIAETLNSFLATNPEKEDRSKILTTAAEAMFKHQPIGYLPKIESKDDGPVASIINNILKPFNG